MGNVTPSVHFPSVPMNVKDIIQTMEKYFASDFYKDALEEFGKLQHIEEKIAQDENLVWIYALLLAADLNLPVWKNSDGRLESYVQCY